MSSGEDPTTTELRVNSIARLLLDIAQDIPALRLPIDFQLMVTKHHRIYTNHNKNGAQRGASPLFYSQLATTSALSWLRMILEERLCLISKTSKFFFIKCSEELDLALDSDTVSSLLNQPSQRSNPVLIFFYYMVKIECLSTVNVRLNWNASCELVYGSLDQYSKCSRAKLIC